MNPAKNRKLGRHYGKPLAGGLGDLARLRRREGFDTATGAAFDTLTGAGVEPRQFATVVGAALVELGLPPDRPDLAPADFWRSPWPLAGGLDHAG